MNLLPVEGHVQVQPIETKNSGIIYVIPKYTGWAIVLSSKDPGIPVGHHAFIPQRKIIEQSGLYFALERDIDAVKVP